MQQNVKYGIPGGSAHVCNTEGVRYVCISKQIDAENAAVLPRGILRKNVFESDYDGKKIAIRHTMTNSSSRQQQLQ